MRILPIGDPIALKPNPRDRSKSRNHVCWSSLEIEDVGPVNGAELDMLDAVRRQDVNLFDRVLRDLVGEGAQANHR